jgi:hypothetical protein
LLGFLLYMVIKAITKKWLWSVCGEWTWEITHFQWSWFTQSRGLGPTGRWIMFICHDNFAIYALQTQ